jgi:UDP-4-keto-D-FucNAc 4-reductase
VAITGASGFVGRHLLGHLAASGCSLVAMSRRGTGVTHVRDLVLNNYADISALAANLDGVDTLIHLAARAHQGVGGESDAALFHEANVDSAVHVARACVLAGVRRLVLLSSIGVHGSSTHGRPFTEADAPAPKELYAISKWRGEQAVSEALDGRSTELVVLRPPLVYGPGAPGNFGQLLKLVQRLPLVPLGGLHRRRSFIHIDNLCDAIVRAAWHPQAAGRRFVLCDGEDVSVAQIARELATGFGRSSRCVVDVPEAGLRWAASLLGRGAALEKLAGELRIDASAFRAATGWLPPRPVLEALRETAARSRSDSTVNRPTP